MIEFLMWIVLGLIAGWVASIIMRTNSAQGPLMDIILGILGALVGGFIMQVFGFSPAAGFSLYSIFVAVLGAVVLIWLGRNLRSLA